MNRALALVALLAACGGDEVARPAPATKPDPRLAAMFDVIAHEAVASAARAKIARLEQQHAPHDAVDGTLVSGGVVGGIVAGDPIDPPRRGVRSVDLRYQRGMRDYPSDLVDPQADLARRAVTSCLNEDDDVSAQIDRAGTVTLTVRIDHDSEPATVRVAGGVGLQPCVERRLVVLPADGIFLAVLRITAF